MKRGDSEHKRWWCTPALEDWLDSLPSEPEAVLPKPMRLVISGVAPRTHKNSPQIFRGISDAFLRDLILSYQQDLPMGPHGEGTVFDWLKNRDSALPRPMMLPSANYQIWHHGATKAALPVLEKLRTYLPITTAVHVLAKVYREADQGDWCGYMQGIGDWMEHAGVLLNDRQIASWDGSRLYKDADNPRVELWVTPYVREGDVGLFSRPAKEWAENEEAEPEEVVEAESFMGFQEPDPPEAAGSRLQLFTRYAGIRR